MNGYLAEDFGEPDSELSRMRKHPYVATRCDWRMLTDTRIANKPNVNAFQKAYFHVWLLIDMPVSLCADTLILPFYGIGYLARTTHSTNEVQGVQQDTPSNPHSSSTQETGAR